MKNYVIESWYTSPTYARTEVIADNEKAAIKYALYLEFNGQLDYDDQGDTIDSGTEVVAAHELCISDPIVALDKNGIALQVGDRVKFSVDKWDSNANAHVPQVEEDEISFIVQDNGDAQVGVGDDIDGFYNFVEAKETERVGLLSTLSDRDYWLQHGDCPRCRKGNTVKPQAGEFVCSECNWKH